FTQIRVKLPPSNTSPLSRSDPLVLFRSDPLADQRMSVVARTVVIIQAAGAQEIAYAFITPFLAQAKRCLFGTPKVSLALAPSRLPGSLLPSRGGSILASAEDWVSSHRMPPVERAPLPSPSEWQVFACLCRPGPCTLNELEQRLPRLRRYPIETLLL